MSLENGYFVLLISKNENIAKKQSETVIQGIVANTPLSVCLESLHCCGRCADGA